MIQSQSIAQRTFRSLVLAGAALALLACGSVEHSNADARTAAIDARTAAAIDASASTDSDASMLASPSPGTDIPAGAARMTGNGMTLHIQLGGSSVAPTSGGTYSVAPTSPLNP